jgi:hypothetical protein
MKLKRKLKIGGFGLLIGGTAVAANGILKTPYVMDGQIDLINSENNSQGEFEGWLRGSQC